jgi:hypothetical protein
MWLLLKAYANNGNTSKNISARPNTVKAACKKLGFSSVGAIPR